MKKLPIIVFITALGLSISISSNLSAVTSEPSPASGIAEIINNAIESENQDLISRLLAELEPKKNSVCSGSSESAYCLELTNYVNRLKGITPES